MFCSNLNFWHNFSPRIHQPLHFSPVIKIQCDPSLDIIKILVKSNSGPHAVADAINFLKILMKIFVDSSILQRNV